MIQSATAPGSIAPLTERIKRPSVARPVRLPPLPEIAAQSPRPYRPCPNDFGSVVGREIPAGKRIAFRLPVANRRASLPVHGGCPSVRVKLLMSECESCSPSDHDVIGHFGGLRRRSTTVLHRNLTVPRHCELVSSKTTGRQPGFRFVRARLPGRLVSCWQ